MFFEKFLCIFFWIWYICHAQDMENATSAWEMPKPEEGNFDVKCITETVLPLDDNYISIRALVDENEKGKSGFGFVSILFDRATQVLRNCNVENPSVFITFDAESIAGRRYAFNKAIFQWSFNADINPLAEMFHVVVSSENRSKPFSTTSVNLNRLPKKELRIHRDSIELDDKVSILRTPECNFIPNFEDIILHQLFIQFYVPQHVVDCHIELDFQNGYVLTSEKFDNNATLNWQQVEIVGDVSQSQIGSILAPENFATRKELMSLSFMFFLLTIIL